MAENERQQEMIERLQEDERLRGDLGDEAAAALLSWAEAQVRALTDDPSRPNEEVEPAVLQVRSAARRAAKSGADNPQAIAAQAEAELATLRAQAAPSAAPAQPVEAVLAPSEPAAQTDAEPSPAQPVEAVLAPSEPAAQTDAEPATQAPQTSTPPPDPAPAAPAQPAAPASPAGMSDDAIQEWRERLRRWFGR